MEAECSEVFLGDHRDGNGDNIKHFRDTSSQMMEAETVSKMLDINFILMWLIVQEDFTAIRTLAGIRTAHHESKFRIPSNLTSPEKVHG
jgi:hypothetical protein